MNDDLIRRGELAEEVKSLTVYVNGLRAGKGVLQEYAKQYRDSLLRIIDEQAAVYAVEVVRCKDCIHGGMDVPDFLDQYYCRTGLGWNKADFFCAYGERREDDG